MEKALNVTINVRGVEEARKSLAQLAAELEAPILRERIRAALAALQSTDGLYTDREWVSIHGAQIRRARSILEGEHV